MFNSLSILMPDAVAPSLRSGCDKPSVSGFNVMEQEIWLPVGIDGDYFEVSNFGNVRSYKNMGLKPGKADAPKTIKPCTDGRGYYNFTIRVNKKSKVLLIHRLVATLFIPNPQNLPIVRHLNDCKTDNNVNNLAWGTYKDNRMDGIANGKFFHKNGFRAAQAKLTEAQVLEIFNLPDNNCAIARKYGVTESTISKIKLGRGWNHITGAAPRKRDYRKRKNNP